jgi:gas vesicle protein
MLNDESNDTDMQRASRSGFPMGLVIGGFIGAVLALAFAPRAGAELRRSVAGTARDLGTGASERYQDASARVGDAVAQLASTARAARDDAADQVARGAHDIARFATSAKS